MKLNLRGTDRSKANKERISPKIGPNTIGIARYHELFHKALTTFVQFDFHMEFFWFSDMVTCVESIGEIENNWQSSKE